MKRKIISLLLVGCLIVAPISVIAEETETITEEAMDYDTLKAEYESLKARHEIMQKSWSDMMINSSGVSYEEYEELQENYNDLAAAYELLQKELDELKQYETEANDTEATVKPDKPKKNPSDNAEILFRGVPWGTNYSEVQQLLPDFDWYDMSSDHMKHFPVEEILTDDYDYYSVDFSNGGINMMATPFTNKETDVAGYTTSDIELFFAYTPVNGALSKDNTATALYGARYEFEPKDLSSMSIDLIDKLSSLYGEPNDKTNDTDLWGNKMSCTWWRGTNDTVVVLRTLDSSNDTTGYYEDELWISYAWEKGDDLLKDADNAVSTSDAAIEAENFGNGSTNGL